MKFWKIVCVSLIILLTVGTVVAYTGTGSSTDTAPITECNDGEDNDNDVAADTHGTGPSDPDPGLDPDPGCTSPAYADDSEGDIYDLDASWVFSGNSAPTDSGPSVFFGSEVVEEGDTSSPFKDSENSGSLVEHYVENADDEWGGGEPSSREISVSDGEIVDRDGSSHLEIIDPPATLTNDKCGDGKKNEDSEGNFDCPEDYGLPDDVGSTEDHSSGSLTPTLSPISRQSVQYDVGTSEAFEAHEFEGDDAENPEDITDVCTSSSCTDDTETFSIDSISNSPDFFLKDSHTEIWSVYPIVGGSNQIGEEPVTDVGLVEEDIIDVKEVEYTDVCDSTHPNCSMSTRDVCTDRTEVYEKTLDTDTVTVGNGENSNHYTTQQGSSQYSYDIDSTPQSLEFQTEVNIRGGNSGNTYYECSTIEEVDYATECPEEGCNDGTEYYVSSTASSVTVATGYQEAEVEYRYDTISFEESKVFDLNPNSNPHSTSPARALFSGDTFKSSGGYGDIVHTVSNDNAYFSWPISDDSLNLGNDPAVSLSRFDIDVDSSNNFVSERQESHTYDADGNNGQGDGYIAISEGDIVGSAPDFLSQEITDGSSADFVSNDDIPVPSCPGDFIKCVASVDVSLQNLNNWGSAEPNSGLDFDFGRSPHETNASFGVCKMYKSMYDDPSLTCEYDGPNGPPTPPGNSCEGVGRAVGDEPGEYWVYMEGPEVNETVLQENPAHYQVGIDTTCSEVTKSSCNLKGNVVPEGRVANVAEEYQGKQYETGGNSPDEEVCLDLEGTGIGNEGDEVPGDNQNDDIDQEDYGGEWYDLDSEMAQQYLRSEGSGLTDDAPSNEDHISYYWRENPNPVSSIYNPEGESEGIALEDDCGNPRFSSDTIRGCNDAEGSPLNGEVREPTFYSFFEEGKRDEDHHPQGTDTSVDDSVFTGYVNKLSDMSDQLEPDMATTNYYTSTTNNPDIWSNSNGSQDAADQWAISQNLTWSISSRGVPYPPWGTYYRDSSSQRVRPESGPASKTEKAFGNSYAAVADTEMTDDNGNTVHPGDGVWIDPDYIREAWNSDNFRWDPDYNFDWKNAITFNMDITGPDSGIGVDLGDGTGVSYKGTSGNQEAIVYGDIYFQGESDEIDNDGDGDGTNGYDEGPSQQDWEGTDQVGETITQHEPPVCGDDQKEFLIEQMGESQTSAQYTGAYACANVSDACVDMSSTPRIVEGGAYTQANEEDEDVGRLKNDVEYCGQRTEDGTSLWYDQDYGDLDGDGVQDTCRVNDIYGERGVKWFSDSYVEDYPHAVTGGIDDDWNHYIEDHYNTGNSDEFANRYESNPNQESWNFNSESPVPSGARAVGNGSIATLGFCGGDDDGEHLVTQECNTDLCETDRDIRGVAKNPGSCVFDPATLDSGYNTGDTSQRELHQPGDEIEIDLGADSQTIACFNGKWFEDWPVVFNQDRVEVPLGESTITSFEVINVRQESTTFEVEMLDPLTEEPSAYQHSTFVEKSGSSFEVTVPPQSSETFSVDIRGANLDIDGTESEHDLEIEARAVNSEMNGIDSTTVEVVEDEETGSTEASSEPRSVPGIGPIHVMMLVLMSSAVFFLQS